MEPIWLIALFFVSFCAGLIDSIAGGGGLLMIPSLLLSGISPQFALGTNKLISSSGTSVAVFNFVRKKKTDFKIASFGILFALIGSFLGSKAILSFEPELVGKIIIFLLPLAVIITLYPKKAKASKKVLSKKDLFFKVPVICFIIGFYDGFFGPGTGSFLAIAFYAFVGLGLLEATANAKVINLLTNIGALIAFIIAGKVIYAVAIPLAFANMIGNYVGSKLAITKGEKVIKTFLTISLVILLITLIWKFLL